MNLAINCFPDIKFFLTKKKLQIKDVYYISRIQWHKWQVKLRWLQHFPDYEVIVELDSLKSMHAYNWLEEKVYVECLQFPFRLIDFAHKQLYNMGLSLLLDGDNEV